MEKLFGRWCDMHVEGDQLQSGSRSVRLQSANGKSAAINRRTSQPMRLRHWPLELRIVLEEEIAGAVGTSGQCA